LPSARNPNDFPDNHAINPYFMLGVTAVQNCYGVAIGDRDDLSRYCVFRTGLIEKQNRKEYISEENVFNNESSNNHRITASKAASRPALTMPDCPPDTILCGNFITSRYFNPDRCRFSNFAISFSAFWITPEIL